MRRDLSEKLTFLITLYCIVFLFHIPCAAKEINYEKKPAWWDKINIKIVTGPRYNDTYYKTFEQQNYGGAVVENWAILGPFDNNKNKPFSKTYGPEKSLKYDRKKTFKGLKGKEIKWSPWRKGTKCPVDEEQRIDKSVFFLYSVYKSPKAEKLNAIFTSDDGAEIWVNKKKVFEFHDPRGRNFIDPDFFEANLVKGKNEILIKLENRTSNWGFKLLFTKLNPQEVKLKTLIELYNKAPKITEKDKTYLSRSIRDELFKMDDFENYIYWYDKTRGTKYKSTIMDLSGLVGQNKEFMPYVIKYYMNFFGNPKNDKAARQYCAEYIINRSVENDDWKTLQRFFDIYSESLKTMLPHTYTNLKVRMLIRKGEFEKANKIGDGLIAQMEKISDNKEKRKFKARFKEIFELIKTTKGASIQLPMDWDYKTIEIQANKYKESKKSGVNRFIRQTLSTKGGQLIPSEQDKNLYHGPLKHYKKIFEPFAEEYSKDLDTYLSLLKNATTLNETSFLQRKGLLSLNKFNIPPYKSQVQQLSIASIKLPFPNSKAYAFLKINQGANEILAENNPVADKLLKPPPGYIASYGRNKVFQNYHEIICVADGKVKWKYASPDSIPKTVYEDERGQGAKVLFSKVTPVIDDGQVYSRLMKNGILTLFCFDLETGNINWMLAEKNTETCSAPAVWRERLLLLVKEFDMIPRYYVVELDKRTGEIARKSFAFATNSTFLHKRTKRFQADLFTPAPLVDGNHAYISTNNGLVLSYDMLTNSFNWVRKYNKSSYTDDKMANALAFRQSSSPVANSENVMFQPLNSAYFMLLNKQTGEKAAFFTLNWKEVVPCGNQVIIIDSHGRAGFYSLKDLKKQKALPGKGYNFVQKLQDGIVLQSENRLEVYDLNGKKKKSFEMPKNTRALYLDQNSLFSYNTVNKAPATIEQFLLKKPKNVLNSEPVTTMPELYRISMKKLGNENYIISRGAIIRVNPDTSIKWIRSIPPSRRRRLLHGGKYLYVCTYSRIFCLEKETGNIVNLFPAYGGALREIQSEIASPQGVAFQNGPQWDAYIKTFSPEKIETLAKYKGDVSIAVFEFGALLAAWRHYGSEVQFLRKDPQKGYYSTSTKTCKLKKGFRPNIRREINDQSVMLTNLDNMLLVNADRSIHAIPLEKGKKKMPGWGRKSRDFFTNNDLCIFRNYYDLVNIVDFKKKKDLAKIPNYTNMPVMVNNKMIGLSKNDIVCFDPESEKIVYTIKNWVEQKKGKGSLSNYALPFKYGNQAAFFFQKSSHYNERRSSQIGYIVLVSPDKSEVEKIAFPCGESDSECFNTGAGLMISLPSEGRVLRLPQKTLDSLKEKAPNIFSTKNTPIQYTIDGFPDEWDLSKFHQLNNNRFNARVINEKELLLAIELNDREAIDKMGKAGLDERFRIMISIGPVASLKSADLMKTGKSYLLSFYREIKSSTEDKTDMSYTVKPDGSSCFIELKVPLNKIVFTYIPSFFKGEARLTRGDFAFDIIFTDYLGIKHALLSKSEVPALYPKLFFPDLTPKPKAKKKADWKKLKKEKKRKMKEKKKKKK